MPHSKVAIYKQQLRAAEEDVELKAQQLAELKHQVAQARLKIDKLEGEVNTNAALEDDVQTLLRHQQETASAFKDYENRVLALELQGLVDRWRAMDIEELAQQNHDLRGECMRLQHENMELSRMVAESSLSSRRDLAKIEMALELTVKEKVREMHDRLRQELYDEMDDKTKKLVTEHGYLQDYVRDQAAQAATLDRHCRTLQAERNRLKVDADVATNLSEQQASQAVGLRRQLKQALQAVELLRRNLAESEARAQAAWDEAVRASSRAAVAAAAAARAGLHGLAEVDGDSAYGMAGESAELAAMETQLRHAKQRFERMRLQRDRWRDRSVLYEKACAQLQAALQTLQDQSKMSLPGGVKQDLDAIWCAVKAATPDADSGGGGSAYSSRPSTAQVRSGGAAEMDASGGGGGGGGGGIGWPVGGGVAAAGAARARAASARMAGASGPARSPALPARPQTAVPYGGSVGAPAARRAAEAIRAAVNMPQSPTSPVGAAFPGDDALAGGGGGGGEGGGEGQGQAPPTPCSPEDEAAAARGSMSPPGRVAMSRLYSGEPEPFKVVPRVQYDQTGWPVKPEFSPKRAQSASSVAGGRPTTLHVPLPSGASPLALMAPPPGSSRRTPGSMRPHSAVQDPPPSTTSRWSVGMSLTGLTSPSAPPPAAAAAGTATALGGGDADAAVKCDEAATTAADGTAAAAAERRPDTGQPASPPQQQQQPRWQGSVHCGGEGGGAGLVPPPLGTARCPTPRLAGAQHAAEADWQAWQAQRERSRSPEYAAIARATAATAAAMLPSGEAGGRPEHSSAGDGAPPAPSSLTTLSGNLPEVGMTGGALYTVVHTIAASVGAGGGGGGGGGLRSTAPSGSPLSPYRPPAQMLSSGGGGVVGPITAVNPSALLSALRRPPSSFKRLHNPDVMFTGVRATSARGTGLGGTRGLGAAGTAGMAAPGAVSAAVAGSGGGVGRPSSTGSMGTGL